MNEYRKCTVVVVKSRKVTNTKKRRELRNKSTVSVQSQK